MTSLYEQWRPDTRQMTEVITDTETGLPLIIHTQPTRDIIEVNKRQAASFDPHVRRSMTHVARLPMNVWRQLVATGVAKDEAALNRWLSDPDNRVFRVDDGRKL